jgi:membrane protein implicated in regulation of membrane protease activity
MDNFAWYWFGVGMIFILIELAKPNIYLLCFGISSVIVGSFGLLFPTANRMHIAVLFVLISYIGVFGFKLYLKRKKSIS